MSIPIYYCSLRSTHSYYDLLFNATPPPEIYTLSLHDALPILGRHRRAAPDVRPAPAATGHHRHPGRGADPGGRISRGPYDDRYKPVIHPEPGRPDPRHPEQPPGAERTAPARPSRLPGHSAPAQ